MVALYGRGFPNLRERQYSAPRSQYMYHQHHAVRKGRLVDAMVCSPDRRQYFGGTKDARQVFRMRAGSPAGRPSVEEVGYAFDRDMLPKRVGTKTRGVVIGHFLAVNRCSLFYRLGLFQIIARRAGFWQYRLTIELLCHPLKQNSQLLTQVPLSDMSARIIITPEL